MQELKINDFTRQIEEDVINENKPLLKYLLRLWKFVMRSAPGIALAYLGMFIVLALIRPVIAFIWGRYIDTAAAYLPGGEVLPLVLLLLLYYAIDFIAGLLNRYTFGGEDIERFDTVQKNRFQEKVNSLIYEKLARMKPEYWEVPKINDTIDRMMKFASDNWEGMSRLIMRSSFVIISKIVSVISIAASLYIFSPWLCLIVIISPLPTLYTLLVRDKLRFKFIKENSKLQRMAKYYQDLMLKSGAKEVKTMGLFDFFFAKWKVHMDEYTVREKRDYRVRNYIDLSNNLVASAANIGANILAIVLMSAGRISIGALGAAFSLISTLLSDMSGLFSAASEFAGKRNEAALFFDIMDLKDQDISGGADAKEFSGITAENIRYRYPLTEKYVLDGVSLEIKKGEKIALVGENGAGKTTFVKLLTALAYPSEGSLLINGVPAEEISMGERLGGFSGVAQNPSHYHTFTLADNVFLGDTSKERDDREIDIAISYAGLDAERRDELLGKDIGGTELSGGEWQKLAIARAYYRGRDFIILDEPTSNLDPLAETEIFKKYMDIGKDKTVIIVTHRISVAALAERVIVFENGKIAEDGTHDELIAKDGAYVRLYREQAKWYNR